MKVYVVLHIVEYGYVIGKIHIFKTLEEAQDEKRTLERIFKKGCFIIEEYTI